VNHHRQLQLLRMTFVSPIWRVATCGSNIAYSIDDLVPQQQQQQQQYLQRDEAAQSTKTMVKSPDKNSSMSCAYGVLHKLTSLGQRMKIAFITAYHKRFSLFVIRICCESAAAKEQDSKHAIHPDGVGVQWTYVL